MWLLRHQEKYLTDYYRVVSTEGSREYFICCTKCLTQVSKKYVGHIGIDETDKIMISYFLVSHKRHHLNVKRTADWIVPVSLGVGWEVGIEMLGCWKYVALAGVLTAFALLRILWHISYC